MANEHDDDRDDLDGCDLDFTEDAVDEETADLLALFPDGQPSDKWEAFTA